MPPWALDFIIILWLGASQSPLVRILSLLIFVLRYKQSLQLNNEVQLTGLPFTRPPFPTFEDLCRVGGAVTLLPAASNHSEFRPTLLELAPAPR